MKDEDGPVMWKNVTMYRWHSTSHTFSDAADHTVLFDDHLSNAVYHKMLFLFCLALYSAPASCLACFLRVMLVMSACELVASCRYSQKKLCTQVTTWFSLRTLRMSLLRCFEC